MSTLLKGISDSDTTIMFAEDAAFPVAFGVILIGTEQISYDSNYNAQLDTKAPTADPVFTGSLTLPVLTTTERDALTPTKGMLIYNSSDDVLNYYDGAWKVVANPA